MGWLSHVPQIGSKLASSSCYLSRGCKSKEHSWCTQGSHCLTVLLVNTRSLTGLDNYTSIKRNSHYIWIRKENGAIKPHWSSPLQVPGWNLWQNTGNRGGTDPSLVTTGGDDWKHHIGWELITYFIKQPDSQRAALQEWDNTILGALLCSSSTLFDGYPSCTEAALVLFQHLIWQPGEQMCRMKQNYVFSLPFSHEPNSKMCSLHNLFHWRIMTEGNLNTTFWRKGMKLENSALKEERRE